MEKSFYSSKLEPNYCISEFKNELHGTNLEMSQNKEKQFTSKSEDVHILKIFVC